MEKFFGKNCFVALGFLLFFSSLAFADTVPGLPEDGIPNIVVDRGPELDLGIAYLDVTPVKGRGRNINVQVAFAIENDSGKNTHNISARIDLNFGYSSSGKFGSRVVSRVISIAEIRKKYSEDFVVFFLGARYPELNKFINLEATLTIDPEEELNDANRENNKASKTYRQRWVQVNDPTKFLDDPIGTYYYPLLKDYRKPGPEKHERGADTKKPERNEAKPRKQGKKAGCTKIGSVTYCKKG